MKIDRHNYEEFFILYWDNELTASQKQAVENFVKENADLQEEFKVFGETRLIPDKNIHLAEKEFLQNDSFINITSYEDHLLDYIDDELTPDQDKKVEKFAAAYPAIQKELSLLQKTKVQPEEISFPDKSLLYRREEKVRVISIYWRRVAVAAAIILVAGLITFRVVNNTQAINEDAIAGNNPATTTKPTNTQPVIIPPNEQQTGLAGVEQKTGTSSATATAVLKEKKKPVIKPTVDKPSENLIADYKPENKNNLPREAKRNQTTSDPNLNSQVLASNDTDIPNVKRDINRIDNAQSEKVDDPLGKSSVTKSPTPTFASIDEDIDDFKKEKGGIKEFLRKTTRVFERRTKIQTTTEDNKLLLGAFAVSLK